MWTRWQQIGIFVMLLPVLTLAGSCTPVRPWSDSFVYHSPHYSIRTNLSPKVAAQAGDFLEEVLPATCQVLGCPPSFPRLFVYMYASVHQYEKVVGPFGLTRGTTGFYSPLPPKAIHLSWRFTRGVAPQVTLLHEGVHQLIDQTFAFSVPTAARKLLPAAEHSLIAAPLWLNEGLAGYMEGALSSNGSIVVGTVNSQRLSHLKQLIRSGKIPPLRKVLSRSYGESFNAADYAVAWGIVYTLRHAATPMEEQRRRQRLEDYLAAAQGAFFKEPEKEFITELLADGLAGRTLTSRWHRRLAGQSLKAFKEIILGEETTLDEWQHSWRHEILQLQP